VSDSAQWHHHQEWPGEPRHVRDVRHFVSARLAEHGLTAMTDDVILVVSELATNAVLHADTPFGVSLSLVEGNVLLQVTDASAAQPRVVAGAPTDMSGRGLSIVETVSQTWGVDNATSGCKNVWASLASPHAGSSGRPV
jgi:anti-sigma regulatory factor (Ser/Thr protein kinase)